MSSFPRIPESEFDAYLQSLLKDLSDNIRSSDIPLREIARGARVKWDTVYAAVKRRPIRVASAARIIYYIRQHKAAQAVNTPTHEENQNHRPADPA